MIIGEDSSEKEEILLVSDFSFPGFNGTYKCFPPEVPLQTFPFKSAIMNLGVQATSVHWSYTSSNCGKFSRATWNDMNWCLTLWVPPPRKFILSPYVLTYELCFCLMSIIDYSQKEKLTVVFLVPQAHDDLWQVPRNCRPSLQLVNPETDFPSVCVLRPTKSLTNLRMVILERAESSVKLLDDIDTAFACRSIGQQYIY